MSFLAGLAALFTTSFVISLTGALSPGPLTTLAAQEGVRRGAWAGPALALGHGVVELALVIGLALGLDRVLEQEALTATIALLGGLFLLWLGLSTIRSAPQQTLPERSNALDPPTNLINATTALQARPLVAVGGAVSISNPFWVIWWATVGAAYVVEALDYGPAGVAAFYSAHILTDLGWLSLIAFALASGRRVMNVRVYRGVLALCGVFLIGLAGWFLASGAGHFL